VLPFDLDTLLDLTAAAEAELGNARHRVVLAFKNLRLARLELRLAEQQAEIEALRAAAE
jgi:hypothetical protein